MVSIPEFFSTSLTSGLIALAIVLVIGYVFLFWERSGIPPGPPFWPVVGNIFNMRGKYFGRRHVYLEEMKAKYGPVFRIYLGNQLTVFLNDQTSIKEAIVDQKDVFIARPTEKLWGYKMSALEGPGLAMANGEDWKAARSLVVQAFHEIGSTSFEEIIRDEIKDIIALLSTSSGDAIRIRNALIKATTSVIGRVSFGSRLDYSKEIDMHIFNTVRALFKGEGSMSPIHTLPFLRFLPGIEGKLEDQNEDVAETRQEFSRYIDEHKKKLTEHASRDLIDVFLKKTKTTKNYLIDEQNLTRIILDLFAAGSIANGNVVDWAFLYMILQPNIQKKCQDEIDRVVGSKRMVRWSDKPNLPYLEATLMEAYRLGNNAPLSIFHMNTKDAYVKGYLIPKESIVIPNVLSCHLDQTTWNDPLAFRPERFLDESGKIKPHPAFMPFMIGPRFCVGETLGQMQIFLMFSNILQIFVLSKEVGAKLTTEGTYGINMETSPYLIHAKRR
ncbi:vitamin D 25-hydroxylase [Patella vulgata]|uniref:vitamin D 25-hydroxylase n=1 Tax=Patella vulgata TaxID=6465 RepID=UPI0024A8835D|nr:vitamin D 25-hydroxylase [Patella vulgata]